MRRYIALVLTTLAIALFIAACGGDGGITVVPDDERQERQDILDRESDGDTGLGDENSGDAQDDTLGQELDGDGRRGEADSSDALEVVDIEGFSTSMKLRELPCFADEGYVRTAAGRVGCASITEFDDIVSCGENSRPVVDLADLPDDAGSPFIAKCASVEDTPDEVFDDVATDGRY